MGITGIKLNILSGPTLPVPLPGLVSEMLESAEVTHGAKSSGLQMTFQLGRQGIRDFIEFKTLQTLLLNTGNRIILTVLIGPRPRVIFDGIITNWEHSPTSTPGQSSLNVTAEDISVMMDRREVTMEHPAQDETIIALKTIAMYAQYGMVPMVIPPIMIDPPIPLDRIPVQSRTTDLKYLRQIGRRFGHVFYVTPGPLPGMNRAYWGPPIRVGIPQKAITLDMGSFTNASNIKFQNNATRPTFVSGMVQDRFSNQAMPVQTFAALRIPLAVLPSMYTNFLLAQKRELPGGGSGLNYMQAYARAQACTDQSVDRAVTATGTLDTEAYGTVLEPRGLVGMRGVGYMHDGFWYVESVTHKIKRGAYTQDFKLAREGLGSLTPVVPV